MDAEKVDIDFTVSDSWTSDMDKRWKWLQENEPVYWSEKSNCWIITSFADVVHVSKNNKLFCSGQGVRPNSPVKLGLIDEDEPRHTQLRGLINKGFTPRMVKMLEEKFAVITQEAIDGFASKGECDFVDDFAVPLPLLLIAEMIGIRKEDRERFHEWSDRMIAGDGNFDNPEIMAKSAQAFQEYTKYVGEILEDRRQNPQDDLASILVNANEGGLLVNEVEHHGEGVEQRLGRDNVAGQEELLMFMVLLLVAGNETTRNGISGSMQLLIENPEARQRLIADPSLIPAAVEEMLRLVSPVRTFSRTATEDATLRDKQIKKGDTVFMLYGAANRDPEEFENPDTLDIDRNPHHVAFGIGNHFCLGANLARMELRVAFEQILRRLPDMEFSEGGAKLIPSALVRTCEHMRVKFTPEG